MTSPILPPTSELLSVQDLAVKHAPLLTVSRLKWALRNRTNNGLVQLNAVYESKSGLLLIWEPKFLAWFLGLEGRHRPRSQRRKMNRRAD